jgi:phage terminase small subunit
MNEKRGRKSAEDLAIVSLASARRPIEPPADLKRQEAEIFREVVAACAANHFRKSDIPILTAFATATHLSRYYAERIGETEGAFKNWEAAARMQVSLATKLRITPQSRYDPKTIARREPHDGPAPWEGE